MSILREFTALEGSGCTLDEEAKLLRGVAICGRVSKNGYEYSEKALREAAPLYEGVSVFLDHGAAASPTGRSVRDLAGRIEGVPTFDGNRLRGDLRILETDAGRTLASLVKASAPNVGLSHVVEARKARGSKLVESIQRVVSVDAVAYPATTNSFSEQNSGDGRMDYAAITYSELKSARPELLTEAVRESGLADKLAAKDADLSAKDRELAELKAKVDAFETRDKLAARKVAIVESAKSAGIDTADTVVFSEAFVASLMDCADDAQRDARIKDRAALVKTVKEQAAPVAPPVNGTRQPAPGDKPWSPQDFFTGRFAVAN